MKIKKVLIANRGEIACRIIKTLKKMNIASVAVYSEADHDSLHVHMADESVCIGPAPSMKSYLNIEAISNAVLSTKADAVHPGFGFLSENHLFAKRLEEMGIHFIGPNPEIILIMGDKVKAKNIASDAGVNVVEGYIGELNNAAQVIEKSQSIGFPIILKAVAGGGGKGMRIISSLHEVEDALNLARTEAAKSFSDSRIFIEKYIEKPRHIEIQILADKFGNIVCLGERECSIQRRYQKVIEEAPSCFINEKVRQKMYEQSVILAKKVGYYSAGTVEFIMDQNKNFYFLEMNTRIQVEHPVTELVTGIDIVQEMINIENGERLNFKQSDVSITGHAIEVRIYAEDPSNNFLPASGIITDYIDLKEDDVRIDSGVQSGSEVTMFYDPMLAKICSYGLNREIAISQIKSALRKFYISGVKNNVSFLQSIISNTNFIAGNLHTDFINDFYPDGFNSDDLTNEIEKIFIASILYIHLSNEYRNIRMFSDDALEGHWVVTVDGKLNDTEAEYSNGTLKSTVNSETVRLNTQWTPGNPLFEATINNVNYCIKLKRINFQYILKYDGYNAKCAVYRAEISQLLGLMHISENQDDDAVVISPITGMITKVYVSIGDKVTIGQPLFIIEAMKMENMFYAKTNAEISKINCSEEHSVNANDVVIEYSF